MSHFWCIGDILTFKPNCPVHSISGFFTLYVCPHNIWRQGTTQIPLLQMITLDYTTCLKQLALFACVSQALFGSVITFTRRSFFFFNFPKERHKQGNLAAMQTRPRCMWKGENPLDIQVYCNLCDGPHMAASCKVSGFPRSLYTDLQLIIYNRDFGRIWFLHTSVQWDFALFPLDSVK